MLVSEITSDAWGVSFNLLNPPQNELAAVLVCRLIAALVSVVALVSSPVVGVVGD